MSRLTRFSTLLKVALLGLLPYAAAPLTRAALEREVFLQAMRLAARQPELADNFGAACAHHLAAYHFASATGLELEE